jgi:hypothetical protein
VLGALTFEVLSETELPEDGLVVYRMRPWPAGEVVRDRVVYGEALVRSAQAERELALGRARARPFRFLLYPIVGLLPEEDQVRLSERLGLYAVTATLVSGLLEAFLILLVPVLLARRDPAFAILAVTGAAGFALLALPALGRAFAAYFLRETGGSAPGGAVCSRRCGHWGCASFTPTARSCRSLRAAFWERLARPDVVTQDGDGSLVYRGLLPHLGWDGTHRSSAAATTGRSSGAGGLRPWPAAPHVPARADGERGGCGKPRAGGPPPWRTQTRCSRQVRSEWGPVERGLPLDDVSLPGVAPAARVRPSGRSAGRPARDLRDLRRRGPGGSLSAQLPSRSPRRSDRPVLGVAAVVLLADAAWRVRSALAGRYAPSLLRWVLPSHLLRPERIAYQAHRDAERRLLAR